MGKHIFENESKTPFEKCTGEEMKAIVRGVRLGHAEFFNGTWYEKDKSGPLSPVGVYRVRAAPNQIDWSQFPDWAVACATDKNELSYILSSRIMKFYGSEWRTLEHPIKQKEITDFPGFKRGTVAPGDSLLIKPDGE